MRRSQLLKLDPQQRHQAKDQRYLGLKLLRMARLVEAPFSNMARALNQLGLGQLRNPVRYNNLMNLSWHLAVVFSLDSRLHTYLLFWHSRGLLVVEGII
jgi:hypothetical protein